MDVSKAGSFQMDQFATANLIKSASQRIAQSNVASVKDQKELSQSADEKPPAEQQDFVSVSTGFDSHQAQDSFDSASASGALTSLMDGMETEQEKEAKDGKLNKNAMFGKKDAQALRRSYSQGAQAENRQSVESSQSVEDIDRKLDAMSAMNKDPREIQGDVPQAFFDAAQKIVEGKIEQGKPSQELMNLKEVETSPVSEEALPMVEIMGIHDTKNLPIPMAMDTEYDSIGGMQTQSNMK
ncbi:MAG: hypothetical protein LWY06_19965 [Firmicutes bacterium]|nr:hypothetical protein [Bacillota bacterium]